MAWKELVDSEEWMVCIETWISLTEAHLSLSDDDFSKISLKDDSLSTYLISFAREYAISGPSILGAAHYGQPILKHNFLLLSRTWQSSFVPAGLLQWDFACDICRVYGAKRVAKLLGSISQPARSWLDASLSGQKKYLTLNLDKGINGDLKSVEERLHRLNYLILASPPTAAFLLAGSDFMDSLITCFQVMNPPLRQVIVTTTYLCHMGLLQGSAPKYSVLTDQLYALKAAADLHKAGPLNGNDSTLR